MKMLMVLCLALTAEASLNSEYQAAILEATEQDNEQDNEGPSMNDEYQAAILEATR
jgi:hypothetical protein